MLTPWSVPCRWQGRTAFILGGGPSLAEVDVDRLQGLGPVIAVNDAGLIRAPWADVLYFSDGEQRWFGWNKDQLPLYRGPLIVTRQEVAAGSHDIKLLGWAKGVALSTDPRFVAGYCGGSNAINLAFLFGASRIVLFGFDMRPGNWHDRHKKPARDNYRDRFIPAIERMAVVLAMHSVEVVNATPGSALACFPIRTPAEIMP